MNYSKWVDLEILFVMIVLYRVLFLVIIKISEIRRSTKRKVEFEINANAIYTYTIM